MFEKTCVTFPQIAPITVNIVKCIQASSTIYWGVFPISFKLLLDINFLQYVYTYATFVLVNLKTSDPHPIRI